MQKSQLIKPIIISHIIITTITPPNVSVGSCRVSRECIVILMRLTDMAGNVQTNNTQTIEIIVVQITLTLTILFVSNIFITFLILLISGYPNYQYPHQNHYTTSNDYPITDKFGIELFQFFQYWFAGREKKDNGKRQNKADVKNKKI